MNSIPAFYGAMATAYEAQIVQVAFRHFARALAEKIPAQGHEHALDLGTGTGILARELRPFVGQIWGLDLSEAMLRAGEGDLLAGDAHRLPFRAQSFDLLVSAFGLNATTPRRLFPEIRRVLKPNGSLIFQEWHILHPLDALLADILADFMVADEDAPDELFALREFLRQDRPWDHAFQTAEDFREELADYGFGEVQVWEEAPVHLRLSIPDFLGYKLAWANRQAELAAMDGWTRADCLDALSKALQDEMDGEGLLNYAPLLFRVQAR